MGRDVKAGSAYVSMYVKNEAFVSGLQKAQERLMAFSYGLRKIGIRITVAGAAMAATFIPTISAASKLQEVMNKFDVVFGKNRDAVKAWSDDFARRMGRSKRQIAEFMAGAQDLFIPLGFDEKSATNMSKQVTGLSLDLASFNDKADADVMRDLQAALTGSGEVMKKYGVILSEAAVKQELMNSGMSKGQANAASDVAKVQARLNIILRGTTAAQGDVIRSSSGYANTVKSLKGALEDLCAEIGAFLLPSITAIAKNTKTVVRLFASLVKTNKIAILGFAKLGKGLLTIGTMMLVASFGLATLAIACSVAVPIITSFSAVLGVVGATIGFIVSPIGLVVVAVSGLVAYFLWASGSITEVLDWLRGGFTVLKDDALSSFKGISDAMAAGDMKLAAKILWAFMELEWLRGLNFLKGLWDDFRGFFIDSGLASIFIDSVSGIKWAWVEMIGFIKKKWNDFSNSDFTEGLADWLAPMMAAIYGVDAEDVRANLKQDFKHKRANSGNYNAEVDAETAAKKEQITKDQVAAKNALKTEMAGRKGAEAKRLAELAAAKAELDALNKEAKDKRAAHDALGAGATKPGPIAAPGMPTAAQMGGTAVGTFSAAQASAMGTGGGNVQERIQKATETVADGVKTLITHTKKGVRFQMEAARATS